MSEVKRYDISAFGGMSMDECSDGAYVNYEDYEKLKEKFASLEVENGLAMESMRKADAAVKMANEKFLSMDDEIQKLRNAYSNEPMAWIHYDNGFVIPAITRSKGIADDWISRGWRVIHLHAKLSGDAKDADTHCDTTNQQFESLSNHKHHFINGACVECLAKSE